MWKVITVALCACVLSVNAHGSSMWGGMNGQANPWGNNQMTNPWLQSGQQGNNNNQGTAGMMTGILGTVIGNLLKPNPQQQQQPQNNEMLKYIMEMMMEKKDGYSEQEDDMNKMMDFAKMEKFFEAFAVFQQFKHAEKMFEYMMTKYCTMVEVSKAWGMKNNMTYNATDERTLEDLAERLDKMSDEEVYKSLMEQLDTNQDFYEEVFFRVSDKLCSVAGEYEEAWKAYTDQKEKHDQD